MPPNPTAALPSRAVQRGVGLQPLFGGGIWARLPPPWSSQLGPTACPQPPLEPRLVQDKAVIKLRGHKTKYAFIEQGRNLRGRDVNLTLAWSIMPRVGECVCGWVAGGEGGCFQLPGACCHSAGPFVRHAWLRICHPLPRPCRPACDQGMHAECI